MHWGYYMVHKSKLYAFKSILTFTNGVAEQLLRNCDKKKCEYILDASNVITSLAFGVLGAIGIICAHYSLLVVAVVIAILDFLVWIGIRHVISERDANIDAEHTKLEEDLAKKCKEHKRLQEEYCDLQGKHKYLNALWAETTLISKEIQRMHRDSNAKRLYTKLASSVSEMVCKYSGIEKEQFSVYIYVYDGRTKMVRRVEVSTCVTSLQTAAETEVTKLSDVKHYFYAKCIANKKTTFSLPDNAAIRKNFFFLSEEDTIIEHYSQYAAMSYNLGNGMELYVEVISYDNAKLGSDLSEFISKVISPFSALVAVADWRKIRSGLE